VLHQMTLGNLIVDPLASYTSETNVSSGVGELLKVHYENYRTLDGHQEKRVARVGDGSIITRFDKTPFPKLPTDVICPHFLELKWATGCPYACAWCYLQGTFRFLDYKTKPRPKSFDRIEQHLLALFQGDGVCGELLNSGELSDSLITEKQKEPFTKFIMNLIGQQDNHRILFVTKSADIDHLLSIENKDQAIVSFSINAEKVAETWENAPRVLDRLDAARRLWESGYEVRLRIDPMVPIEGWKREYERLIDEIFDRLIPERITIGSLRGLQSTINNAKDKSWVKYLNETSNWGKKIPVEKRKEMYSSILNKLREDHGYRNVALCKETVQIWKELKMDYKKIECNCIP